MKISKRGLAGSLTSMPIERSRALSSRPTPKTLPPKGTVPLIEWFSPSRTDSVTQAWRGTGRPDRTVQIQPDYTLPVLLGYVFDPRLPQPKGTVPLFRWWIPSRKDHHTTTMPAWRGGYRESRTPDYAYPQLEGYVYPPPNMAPASPPAAVANRDVTFRLDRVVVHDDCDEVSPGDWFIGIAALNPGDPDHIQRARFPSGGSAHNVDTGEIIFTNLAITLPGVAVTSDIRLVVEAVDCDRDSPLEAALFFPFSLISELDRRGAMYTGIWGTGLCHGEEEFHEVSGNDDFVGWADRIFTPAEWQSGGTFAISASSKGWDCERRANVSDPGGVFPFLANYTATVRISVGR